MVKDLFTKNKVLMDRLSSRVPKKVHCDSCGYSFRYSSLVKVRVGIERLFFCEKCYFGSKYAK